MNLSWLSFLFLPVLFLWNGATVLAQDWELQRLPEGINTSFYNEVAPVMSADGSQLFFTRVGAMDFVKHLPDNGKDLWTSLPEDVYWASLADIFSEVSGKTVREPASHPLNQDIWIATMAANELVKTEHPPAPLNNAYPNSICARTPQSNAYVCINQFPAEGGMRHGFSVVQVDVVGNWNAPKPIIIDDYYTNQLGLTLTLSADGFTLIMSLQREDSYGDTDLYICFKVDENHWSRPVNMGAIINSIGKELTPALSPDNKRLYFAANRSDAEGGTDLYYCTRTGNSWVDWSAPRRFITPINSTADEIQPFFHPLTGHLYFCSNRAGTHDIYRVQVAVPQKEQPLLETLAEENTNPNGTLTVRVRNTKTGELLPLRTILEVDGQPYKPLRTTQTETVFDNTKAGALRIEDPNWIALPLKVIPNRSKSNQNIEILAEPAQLGTQIKLESVLFERTTAKFLLSSEPQLDQLVQLMQQRTKMTIRIEGHTDNNGPSRELLALSKKRAAAVRDYLLQQGIAKNRIEIVGFGAQKPVAENTSEVDRSKNRRVEFVIIGL